ncbi:hypothetical protein PVK06_001769 [Gossypium arboreum]|uniref:CCHC-type domain-containing protein n=1 Tax=Gossypium arboreum TaxID=29729 RepID=A0ABR0R1W6_GOSAR|nr:hypothetical protein PVK06_001769 [Gossypium arboreum]
MVTLWPNFRTSLIMRSPFWGSMDYIWSILDSSTLDTGHPAQAFSKVVMSWIRLPDLPGYLYKWKILVEIGGMIGKVSKLDMNTDNKARGRFARMAVYVNLDRPLVFQILINGRIQKVEYEFLPMVCFQCGRYGHVKEACTFRASESITGKEPPPFEISPENHNKAVDGTGEKGDSYGLWMLVERKSRRKFRDSSQIHAEKMAKDKGGVSV